MHTTTSALLLASGLAFAWASIPTTEWSEQPSARDEWNEQSEQLSWGTKAPTRWLTQDYVVAVTLSSKYNSDTTATIDIRLTNAAGMSYPLAISHYMCYIRLPESCLGHRTLQNSSQSSDLTCVVSSPLAA